MGFVRITVLLLVLCLALSECKKEHDLTLKEQVTIQLSSAEAWEDPITTVDGVDFSDVYKDFEIAFSNTTYTTTSGAPIWGSSGTWVFANDEATRLLLDGLTDVEINSIDNDFLELSLHWDQDTFEPGRVKSVKGKHKFKFKKRKKK